MYEMYRVFIETTDPTGYLIAVEVYINKDGTMEIIRLPSPSKVKWQEILKTRESIQGPDYVAAPCIQM